MKVGQVWKMREHVIREACAEDIKDKADWEADWIMRGMAEARFQIKKIEDLPSVGKKLLHVENYGEEPLGEFKFTTTPEAMLKQFELDESWS